MGEIRFERVSFSYGPQGTPPLLANLSAVFDSRRVTVVTGPSGCGKSTLLYLAAGIYPQNAGTLLEGTVTAEGEAPGALRPSARCRLAGLMFQNPDLQFCMDTVKNELIFCLENIQTPPEAMDALISEALAFCEIEHLRDRTLFSLSGGEKQKAMLACLAALRPRWLLLDEPFANIDDRAARCIAGKLLLLHRRHGTGILAVDHRLENWLPVADDVRIMDKSGVLAKRAVSPRAFFPAPGGRSQSEKPPKAPARSPALELRGLALRRGDKEILRDVNAAFYPGRIHAIVGESGCGKSSLFGALCGLYRYQGAALLEGVPLRGCRKQAGKIGFVTQSPQDQFVASTVLQEVAVSLRGAPGAESAAERILRRTGLWRTRRLSPYMLSQGQQRRLGVAALLSYDCRVLVCDEPTYAQDRESTLALMEALQEAVLRRGVALILSTHDLRLAQDYADTIFLLEGGTLREIHQPLV